MADDTRRLVSSDRADDPPRLALSPREAAKALGIGTRLLWAWTKSGAIPHARIGARVVYPIAALEQWLADRAAKGVRR